MRQDDRVGQPLLELDRDRGRGAAAAVDQCLGLGANELTELLGLEIRADLGARKQAAYRARDRADARPARGQLAAGRGQPLQQFFAARSLVLGLLHQRFDRAARHPAAAMLAVGSKLLDPLPEDGRHVLIVAGPASSRPIATMDCAPASDDAQTLVR